MLILIMICIIMNTLELNIAVTVNMYDVIMFSVNISMTVK